MDSVDEIWRKSNYFYQFMSLACYVACFLQPHTRWLQNEIEKRLLRSGVFPALTSSMWRQLSRNSFFERFQWKICMFINVHYTKKTRVKKREILLCWLLKEISDFFRTQIIVGTSLHHVIICILFIFVTFLLAHLGENGGEFQRKFKQFSQLVLNSSAPIHYTVKECLPFCFLRDVY